MSANDTEVGGQIHQIYFPQKEIEPVVAACNQRGSGFAFGFLDFTQLWLVMRIMIMIMMTKQ